MLTLLHGAVFSKLMQGLNGFDGDTWVWAGHDGDWIYQGGPDTSANRHDVYFNQWDELDSDPITWHISDFKGDRSVNGADVTDRIFTTEPWQLAVNGIY